MKSLNNFFYIAIKMQKKKQDEVTKLTVTATCIDNQMEGFGGTTNRIGCVLVERLCIN